MKKIITVLLLVVLCACCVKQIQFNDPEYHMKAKVIDIQPGKSITQDNTKIDFFGLSASVLSGWFDKKTNPLKTTTAVYSKDGEKVFVIMSLFEREEISACEKPIDEHERDFCSAFKSVQEYYDKVWNMTPEDLKDPQYATRGNYMLVMEKKSWFTKPVKVTAIYKYCGKDFTAYRRDFQPAEENKTIRAELVIFHQKIRPMSFIITSFVDNNDELFNQILTTIQ
jgi:hypothetical protein